MSEISQQFQKYLSEKSLEYGKITQSGDSLSKNHINQQIIDITKKIHEIQVNRLKFTKILKLIQSPIIPPTVFQSLLNFPNQRLFTDVRETSLHGLSIAGVDGGLVKHTFSGINIAGYRSCGVIFRFGKNKISDIQYFPKKYPDIQLAEYILPISNLEWDKLTSFLRAIEELKTAFKLINGSKKIDFLLMDGSFQEFSSNMNENVDSQLLSLKSTYSLYLKKLIKESWDKGIILVWIIKDSRLNQFVRVLKNFFPDVIHKFPELLTIETNAILENFNDQILMDYLLTPKSRSFLISKSLPSLPKKEFNSWQNFSFYLKIVKFDKPLRIDFSLPSEKLIDFPLFMKQVEKISSVILPLSLIAPSYAFPSPLIEADARARISYDFNSIIESIKEKLYGSPEIQNLKRSRSPFKF